VPPHHPVRLELNERAKAEMVEVLRLNPTWRVGSVSEFLNEFHKISNAGLRVKYPALNNPFLMEAMSDYYGKDTPLNQIF
jgi:hypothetical protein